MEGAAYTAPEQAEDRAVDKRADIWAFSAVLNEMLKGRRAFDGEDVSDTLARILMNEPDSTVVTIVTKVTFWSSGETMGAAVISAAPASACR